MFRKILQYLLITATVLLPVCATAQRAVVSTDVTKVLYAGFTNQLSIAVPGYACDNLEVRTESAITGTGCQYQVVPEEAGEVVLIVRSKKNKHVLDTVRIPVINAPVRVKIALGVENSGQLLRNGPVMASDAPAYLKEAFHFADSFHIAGFRVTLYSKSRDAVLLERTITGNSYDPATIEAITNAQPGDRLFLENIKVIRPDKKKIPFNSIGYTFK